MFLLELLFQGYFIVKFSPLQNVTLKSRQREKLNRFEPQSERLLVKWKVHKRVFEPWLKSIDLQRKM